MEASTPRPPGLDPDMVLNRLVQVVGDELEVENIRAGGASEKRLLHLWKKRNQDTNSSQAVGLESGTEAVVVPAGDPMAFEAKNLFPELHIFAWASPPAADSATDNELNVNLVLTTKAGKAVSSQLMRSEELLKPDLIKASC